MQSAPAGDALGEIPSGGVHGYQNFHQGRRCGVCRTAVLARPTRIARSSIPSPVFTSFADESGLSMSSTGIRRGLRAPRRLLSSPSANAPVNACASSLLNCLPEGSMSLASLPNDAPCSMRRAASSGVSIGRSGESDMCFLSVVYERLTFYIIA